VPDILTARAVNKSYGAGADGLAIIQDLNLAVREGEFVSLVGPSGCGKTTLLMCLAGLLAPTSGDIFFDNRIVLEPPLGLAVVFQDYSRALLPWKTNLDNVLFGMRRVETPVASKREKALDILAAVGLKGFERHYPWQVSGGMQQRVAIARAIASQSKLLLLDEPLAAVDAQTRADMQDLLLELASRYQQTCLLVTHDVDEAVYMADRVLVLGLRPTKVVKQVKVELPRPRDQITTRENSYYLAARHEVLSLIRSMRQANRDSVL
jgi:NitT/TauT family transport system ATP-binding protein